MSQLIVTKTKEYLVFKIPLRLLRKNTASPKEEEAISEGLEAMREGRLSPAFKNARAAVAFLRTL